MAELGIVAIPQPVWFTKGDFFTNLEVPALGYDRASTEYPMNSFYDVGVTVAAATDSIATYLEPLYGLQMAITRTEADTSLDPNKDDEVLGPAERISIEQAIESYTINGAYSIFMDDIIGSLETGKKADLVILDGNLFDYKDHPQDIFSKVHVAKTIFNGEIVFEN